MTLKQILHFYFIIYGFLVILNKHFSRECVNHDEHFSNEYVDLSEHFLGAKIDNRIGLTKHQTDFLLNYNANSVISAFSALEIKNSVHRLPFNTVVFCFFNAEPRKPQIFFSLLTTYYTTPPLYTLNLKTLNLKTHQLINS